MIISRKKYNPHPTHCAYCMVIREAGFDWDRKARRWFMQDWTVWFYTAGEAYGWTLQYGHTK